jgi:radical SAM superfamily enzyme YgiQ (UPF0313 family)
VAEIEQLQRDYGTKEVFFKDDTFTFSPVRTERICDLILRKGIKLRWSCYARVNTISQRVLDKMVRAGCFALDFGIESGNQRVLDNINKNITLEQAERAMALAKKRRIMTYASFMFGLPGEGMEEALQTIAFAIKLNPDIAQFFVTTPFPGTELWDMALEKGWIKDVKSWAELNLASTATYRNDRLTNEQIRGLVALAYRRFYLRPGYAWKAGKRPMADPLRMGFRYAAGALAFLSLARN